VQGNFPRPETVRMCRIETEVRAAVLEHDSSVPRHHARAIDTVHAVNERDGVAVGVHRAHRHRVALEAAVRGHAIPRQRFVRTHAWAGARSSAFAFETHLATGTLKKSGSAMCWSRSWKAICFAWTRRCTASGPSRSSRARSTGSMRFSICSTESPWVGGGVSARG